MCCIDRLNPQPIVDVGPSWKRTLKSMGAAVQVMATRRVNLAMGRRGQRAKSASRIGYISRSLESRTWVGPANTGEPRDPIGQTHRQWSMSCVLPHKPLAGDGSLELLLPVT